MSQIPSEATRRARHAAEQYSRCPSCSRADVNGHHVDICEERERYWRNAAERIDEAGIPGATGHDLWAHAYSRTSNPLLATAVVRMVIDLGWRPVVGSEPARLWTAPTSGADVRPDERGGA